jgi:hypothetical protein
VQLRGHWLLRVAEICNFLMGKRSFEYASLVPLHAFGLQWTLIGSSVAQHGASVPNQPKNGWIMSVLQVLRLIVPAKVRTSHGPTTEEILQGCREGSNASAREEPKAPATTPPRLAAADIRLSVVPPGSRLLSMGL